MKKLIILLFLGLLACHAEDSSPSVLVVNKTTCLANNMVEYEVQDCTNSSLIYRNQILIYAPPGMYNAGDILTLSKKK